MNTQQQKEIHTKWKNLESECHMEAQIMIPGQPYKVLYKLDPDKFSELLKYRRWVVAYCLELLDISEKWEIQRSVGGNQIQCKCTTPDCAKCLLINCTDDDCFYHPIEKKEDFRLRYENR